jgi:hypothetical protein
LPVWLFAYLAVYLFACLDVCPSGRLVVCLDGWLPQDLCDVHVPIHATAIINIIGLSTPARATLLIDTSIVMTTITITKIITLTITIIVIITTITTTD